MTLEEQIQLLEEQLAPYRAAVTQLVKEDGLRRKIRTLEAELSMYQRSAQQRQLKLPFVGD
jgi:glycyl-tRNA synthetase (class II)